MNTRTKLPQFKGKPLIEVPAEIRQADFLGGDFGKAFLEEYQGRVEADYKRNGNLNVLRYDSGVVRGSNSFAVVLANQILRQEGLRTANQADLEKVLRLGVLPLRGTYEDTGLVLRSEEDGDYSKNTLLARDLAKQVKERGIELSPKNPVMIPLTGLELENADNDYNLKFRLREDAEIYNAPILNEKNGNFSSEDIDGKTGLPTKLGEGNRTLYTRGSGLSGLGLYYGLGLFSDGGSLGSSYGGVGRVVVVSGEATSPENLQKELADRINNDYQTQLAELNLRRERALNTASEIMSGKK